MTVKEIYICLYSEVLIKPFIIKWIDILKDEVIIFLDENQQIKIFSSICPHFGGEIIYDEKKRKLKCKWHGWNFSAKTGECITYPIKTKLNNYDFKCEPRKLNDYDFKVQEKKIYAVLNEK